LGWIGRKCFADNHLREKRKKNDERECKNEEIGECGKKNGKARILATKPGIVCEKKKWALGENVDLLVFFQPVSHICINLSLFIWLSVLII
jgi:hypothetical protein